MELTIANTVTVQAQPTQTPGLVINPVVLVDRTADLDWRSVTHTASGLRFPLNFPNDEAAGAFAADIADLADWTQTEPDIPGDDILRIADRHGAITNLDYRSDAYRADRTTAL